jgi:hypothetical protein
LVEDVDNGRELADAVVAIVRQSYPEASVEMLPGGVDGRWYTTVVFVPANTDGVHIWLYVNYDWSFDLHVEEISEFDREPYVGSRDRQIRFMADSVLDFASSGIPNAGRGKRSAAWAAAR